MTEKLRIARKTAQKKEKLTNERYRPLFHPVAPVGWINDPNGFGHFQGKTHLFYQYYPYDSKWGPMHWGHWITEDLAHWEDAPVALAPDHNYDRDGCFSGTSLVVNEKMYLAYTGVLEEQANAPLIQQQCIAVSSDGLEFKKDPLNPVISWEMLPEGISKYDFRDPKIYLRQDGKFGMLIAAKDTKGGVLVQYVSQDMKSWTYAGVFAENLGEMCECPDCFELDGNHLLITCLINEPSLSSSDLQNAVYFVGNCSDELFQTFGKPALIDKGLDFYAPQTMLLPDGRRIMVGWAASWADTLPTHTHKHGWAGMMTILRECFMNGNVLCQRPVRELASRRKGVRSLQPMTVDGKANLDSLAGKHCEIELELDVTYSERMTLNLMESDKERLKITFKNDILTIDRSECGHPLIATEDQVKREKTSVALQPGISILKLRIFVDASIVEIFVGEGEHVLTTLAFPYKEEYGVSLDSVGKTDILHAASWIIE